MKRSDRTPRVIAMDYLARREHTWIELQRKLRLKDIDDDTIIEVLNRLREQGLQSDQRFAENFAQQRARNGRGPLKIKQELRQHGVSEKMTDDVMAALDVDWNAIAKIVWQRKFGAMPKDVNERAKQQRFMLQRGFLYELEY